MPPLGLLDALIDAHLASRPQIGARAERLQQVAGVGRVTAFTVLELVPELGRLRDAQAAALVGVAPLNHDSGQFRGQCHIHGGRAAVRRVLYMAALAAIRHNAILRALYQRLIARGTPPKAALTAVMRKLTILLNRLLKNPNFCLVQ